MADKNTIKKVEELISLEENFDMFIMDDIIVSTKYNKIDQDDVARFKKWDIKNVLLSNLEDNILSSGEDFEKFIADRKVFIKIYESSLKKMKVNFHNFRYNNNINIAEVKEIVAELYSTITVNLNSILSIINLYHCEKDIMNKLATDVSILSMMLAVGIGLNKSEVLDIGLGGMIYDVGMFRINDSIRSKVGKYTDEEYTHMKTHTILGYRVLKNQLRLNDEIAVIPLTHHEHHDGKGYPRALSGSSIPFYSRVVAITNAFSSMLNNSNYHIPRVKTPYEAMKEIIKEASKKFDPHLMKAFAALMCLYPIGSFIKLSNGLVGLVISSNKNAPTRPIIKIIKMENNIVSLDGDVINMAEDKDLTINEVFYDDKILSKIF